MNKKFNLRFLMFLLFLVSTIKGFSQLTGDFQTKNPTGNWSDFNAWNIYNGASWQAATTGQIPTVTSSVFVQAGQTISVDNGSAVCNDLDLNTFGSNTSRIAFAVAASILNVKGNIIAFNTSPNCFGTWTPGAKIVFSGTGAQGFTNLSANSVFVNIEVNKTSGTLTTASNFRFGSFLLTVGNFIVGNGFEIQGTSASSTIGINGGTWTQTSGATKINNSGTQTSPIGALNIDGGAMVLQTSNGSGGFRFSTISVKNNGTLTLNSFTGNITIETSISIDATSTFNTSLAATPLPPTVTFDGVVSYNLFGVQTISQATYSYLKLSGTGAKTLEAGTTSIPAGGTLEMSGVAPSPTLSLGIGTLAVSNSASNLLYTSSGAQTASANEWSSNFQNIIINNAAGVNMAGLTRTITGTLNLTNGTFSVGASGHLTLDGASLNKTNGYLDGTSTSDFTVTGTTGGAVLLPLPAATNISLRNITIAGTRTLAMDGLNNINLYGTFTVAGGATYDNRGESQIINGGGGSISITGKFITRDIQGFYGSNTAIPGILPALNSGSTVEYGLLGDQIVQGGTLPPYYNVTFSGSGTKTLQSANIATGTITVSGAAIFNAQNFTFGGFGTNLTMTGTSRYINGGATTKPDAQGTYNLGINTIVEFANNSGTIVRLGISPISYANVVVSGTNVSNASTLTGILFQTGGTFVVTTGATFKLQNASGFSGTTSTAINVTNNPTITLQNGSTIEYNGGAQVITNQFPYQSLSIAGSGIKTAPSGTLTIQGNLTKSGTSTFVHNNGTVLLNGANQTFAGLTYNNLILTNNSKTTSGSSTIIDSIKINDGTTLSLNNGDKVTLHSDATGTARIGQVGTGTINYNASGRFVIERYISGHRAWRHLSVPVTSQTIREAWQEDGITGGTVAGLGTQITGPQSIAAGFDLYSGMPSIKTYNSSTNEYDGVTATTLPFDVSKGGYMLFIRGDRNTVYPAMSSTTLRTTGQLFTGNQGFVSVNDQFTSCNNPYASQIDMAKLSPDGINYPAFYIWDPNLGGTYGYGAFVTFLWNPATSHFDVTNSGGSYADGDHIIDNGQAFLVSTLGTGFSIPVTENVKTGFRLSGGVTPFTPIVRPGQQLRTLLYTIDQDGNYYMSDGVLNNYGVNFSNDIDGMDARKYLNSSENLSIARGDVLLGIERRKTLHRQDTIFFQVNNLKPTGAYRFVFVPSNIEESGCQPYLEDDYFHTRTPLRLKDTTQVNFISDGNAGSNAPGRFRIVFQAAQGPLPLTLTNVKAYTKNESIAVEWTVENETGMKSYLVEKSTDRSNFRTSGIIAAHNNGQANPYSWLDGQPLAGYNYYRVKSVGFNGQHQYSKVVKVWQGSAKSGISVSPNPSRNGIIHLLFNNQPAGQYAIRLINKTGQVVVSKQMQRINAGTGSEEILMDQYTAHGVYRLEITKPGGGRENMNVVY